MSLKRFGVSLDEKLLQALDEYVREDGFCNRSQAIRFLIEKNIAEKKWLCNRQVAGTVVLVYEHTCKEILIKAEAIQQLYRDAVLSSSRYFLNRGLCLHVIAVKGEARRLTELSDKLIAIKGMKDGKLVMSRAE